MAKVKPFSQELVRAYKQTVDLYYWKGIPVARKWPDWSNFKPSARQKLSMAAMKASREAIKRITPSTRAYYKAMTGGSRAPWLDVVTGLYMRGWKKARTGPPVLLDFSVSEDAENYIVTSEWDHSSEIYASILTDYYAQEKQWKEKKGSFVACAEPPFGPLLPDPDTPPDEPDVPFRSRGERKPGDGIDIELLFGSAQWWMFNQAQRATQALAESAAWYNTKYNYENKLYEIRAGQLGIQLLADNAVIVHPSRPYVCTIRWAAKELVFNMAEWYSFSPDVPPATVTFSLFNSEPIPSGNILFHTLRHSFPAQSGFNRISIPFPSQWWGVAQVKEYILGDPYKPFSPPFLPDMAGFSFMPGVAGQGVRLSKLPTKIEWVHYIPKHLLPELPDPRLIYYWDYVEEFLPCAHVPFRLTVS